MMSVKTKGFVYGIIAAVTYGMNPLFALPLYQEGIGTDSVLFYRYAIALVMLGLLMKIKRISFRINRAEFLTLGILGLLFSCSSLFLFESYNYMDAGIASTILFVYPVMVAVIMALFFKEKMTLLTMGCIALALAGIGLLYEGPGGQTLSTTGIVFVLLSSLTYAIYMVGLNRSKVSDMHVIKLTFYAILFGIMIYVVRLDFLTSLQPLSTPMSWINAFSLGLFPTVISLIMITIAIQYIGSTPTAILGALEPVTAVFFGVLIFGEQLTPKICFGIMLILVAVTMIIAGKPFLEFARRKVKKAAR
ncbi:MAG: EamA family transporter [Bacteroidales bacterium]